MFNKRLFAAGIVGFLLNAFASGMTLEECKERAAAGDAEALWQLGQRYENGEGARKDGLKAISQYRKAADKSFCQMTEIVCLCTLCLAK